MISFLHSHTSKKQLLRLFVFCLLFGASALSITLFASKSHADDIQVTAKVNAPLPTSPAIITSPYDQQHFTTSPITVSGTCGDGAYVVLYRNSVASGVGSCTTGLFSIVTDLTPGANQLQARVYNITDNEGPGSPAITVYLDIIPSEPVPPLEAPIALRVTSIDGVPYTQGRIYSTSNQPLIRGYAPPGSTVTIIFTTGVECKTTASSNGRWACALASQLGFGTYTVRVSSVSPQGVRSTFPAFVITVSATIPPASPAEGLRLLLHFPYNYHEYKVYEPWTGDLVITGGIPPYAVLVEWGDGTIQRIENINITPVNLTHVFTKPGNYQPIIKATDQRGNSASIQILVVVVGAEKPAETLSTTAFALIAIGIMVGTAVIVEIAVLWTMLGKFVLPKIFKK